MELVAVAALAENRVIGNGEDIPWPKIPRDHRQYRARVADDPNVLGRRTFEQMRDDLPGSHQIVVSRTERDYDVPTAHHAGSVEEALELAAELGDDVAYVVGGGQIYALFLPYVDRMFLSRIPGEYEGDSYYPEFDESEWALVDVTEYDEYALEEWERR